MPKSTTPSFVLTLPLRYEPWQRDYLDKVFKVSCYMYNNLVADRKKALEQLERTNAWKTTRAGLASLYKVEKRSKAQEQELHCLQENHNVLLKQYELTEYGFQACIQKWRKHYSKLVGTHVAQKIASAVWAMFEDYLYRDGKELHFKSWQEFRSIEGKSNNTNIRYTNKGLLINKVLIGVCPPSNAYEEEALTHRIKYCRIVRIPWKDGWLYKVQLILEGYPPVKVDAETGELLHPMGKGRVGIDIGTQTIAFASPSKVTLRELADKANLPHAEIRRVNRAMDRSRKTTNPAFFNKDGTVIPVDKLPKELLDKCGKRKWVYSKQYMKLAQKRRYLYAKLTRVRKWQHQTLANELLACGESFYVETMRFQALAKKSKEARKNARGKNLSRKRFGKSIANKSPATMVDILEQKVLSQGGQFCRINTWKAKASQFDHTDQTYTKKKLSQRWESLSTGIKIQRDLYSAFLLINTNSTLDGFEQSLCDKTFANFKVLHDVEVQRLQHVAMPASAGIAYRK